MEQNIRKEFNDLNKEELTKQTKIINIVSTVVFTGIYLAILIYAITKMFDPSYDIAQAKLIIMSGVAGMALTYIFYVVDRLFGIKTSPSFRLSLQCFGALGMVLGETFTFYYKFSWWDTLLHFSSGILFSLIGTYLLASIFKKDTIRHKNIVIVVGGTLICLALAFIWEIYEFSMDSLFGLNMQKIIPEIEGIFNGGDTSAPLLGTNEQIAEFFRSPEGYRYALMDTMIDLTVCFIGALIFIVFGTIYAHFKENAFQDKIVFTNQNIVNRHKARKEIR